MFVKNITNVFSFIILISWLALKIGNSSQKISTTNSFEDNRWIGWQIYEFSYYIYLLHMYINAHHILWVVEQKNIFSAI